MRGRSPKVSSVLLTVLKYKNHLYSQVIHDRDVLIRIHDAKSGCHVHHRSDMTVQLKTFIVEQGAYHNCLSYTTCRILPNTILSIFSLTGRSGH